MTRIAVIVMAFLMLGLAGCGSTPDDASGDGYQFGDITGTVLSLQAEYCAETDPRRRAFRIAALRAAGVPLPASGACSDILALIPTSELDVDLEQAEADRKRFEGMSDADRDTAPSSDDAGAE